MADVTPATVSAGASPTPYVVRKALADLTAAPVATEATNSSPYGFATKAQADAILVNLLEIRAVLVAAGLVTT